MCDRQGLSEKKSTEGYRRIHFSLDGMPTVPGLQFLGRTKYQRCKVFLAIDGVISIKKIIRDSFKSKHGMVKPTVEKLNRLLQLWVYLKYLRMDNGGKLLSKRLVHKDWKLLIIVNWTAIAPHNKNHPSKLDSVHWLVGPGQSSKMPTF
jgi:hypothetical protein